VKPAIAGELNLVERWLWLLSEKTDHARRHNVGALERTRKYELHCFQAVRR